MSAREAVRRTGIWMLVAGYLALCIVELIATGNAWPLAGWGGYALVGALLLTLRRRSRIGMLMLVAPVYWAVSGLLYIPGVAAATSVWFELIVLALGPLAWCAMPMLVTIYPDDRLTTRLGAAAASAVGAVAAIMVVAGLITDEPLELSGRLSPLAVPALAPVASYLLSTTTFYILLILIAISLVDLVLRWRRSTGERRLQFRWIFFGGAITLGVLLLSQVFPSLPDWASVVVVSELNAIPVSIFIALSRHGLYEVDRVISRTVSYVLVTAIAVGVYALVVTSVTWLLPGAPSIAVAAATLAAAALFLPVLRGVKRVVDRRFDRERYDAQRIVDAFGERLRTRVDPATTGADLMRVVDSALQPTSVGIWAPETGR